jgi:hypothetical protein
MIEKIITLSLISIGICCTMWDGNIFEKFGNWIESVVGEWWAKPLGKCYVCATFWYSLIICLVVGWQWWLAVPAMGLSAVVSMLQND